MPGSATTTLRATRCSSYEPRQHALAASRCLHDSFREDPLVGAGSPLATAEEYEAVGLDVFRWFLWIFQSFHMTECALTEDQDGDSTTHDGVLAAALWEPASPTLGFALRMVAFVCWNFWARGFYRAVQLGRFFLALEAKRHEHAPTAHHLQILGTDPAAQGQGVGSALIRVGIERAQSLGVPCYLESSNPKNVPFYERHGFVVLEEIYPFKVEGAGRGPVVTLMFRKLSSE